LEPYLICFAEE